MKDGKTNLIWNIIADFPNYAVSNYGEVKNIKTERILKIQVHHNYCYVFLYLNGNRKSVLLHRLVAQAFIPNPNNYPEINHKDENPLNNIVENLEWCSSKYNNNYGTHKEKLRQKMLINNPFKGKKHTDEAKLKMSCAKKGKNLSEKHKQKIRESNKDNGRPGKPVYCLELNKSFNSAIEAERQTGIPNSNIIAVCKGDRKTAGKYHWKYI